MEKSEAQIAIETPKHLRTMRQKEIIFGDYNPNRQYQSYVSWAEELVRRLDEGLPLSKADRREARRLKRGGIEVRGR